MSRISRIAQLIPQVLRSTLRWASPIHLLAMRTFLASLLALLGIASPAQSQQKPGNIDLSTILYTTPTLSNDIAALEPLVGEPAAADLVFHEDEWSQVEFLQKMQLREVQRILKEYKNFELASRATHGWRKVYVRRIDRLPLFSGKRPVQELAYLLGTSASAGPVLTSAGAASGRVKSGFSIPLGGNVALYGYSSAGAIPVLGAYVGQNPDDQRLMQAFVKLNSTTGAILVDWRAQLVLLGTTPEGQVQVWRP